MLSGPALAGRAAIALFYEKLIRISPALGTRVGYAAAVAEASGPETAPRFSMRLSLKGCPIIALRAVRAHLLQRLGKTREASNVYDRAIGLAEDPAVREFLIQKRG